MKGSHKASSDSSICAICLESAQIRGGFVPLTSPGCCGAWFHQHCLLQLPSEIDSSQRSARSIFNFSTRNSNKNQTSKRCPNCRSLFQLPHIDSPMTNSQSPSTSPLFEEEEVTIVDIEESKEVSSSDMPRPSLVLNTSAEYPVISTECKLLYTRVSVSYPENLIAESKSSALDVVCILDNSGSMSGSKIKSLIDAMTFVIETLSPRDRLSVVSFNSNANILHGLIKMTTDNKAKAKEILHSQLRAGGGTDIYAGMKLGSDILQSRRTKNPVSTMFLLTDGQDRDNTPQKMELARGLRSSNCSLFVFGFGADHDSEHMAGIAEAGEGTFCYIDKNETVVDAFGGTIGTLQGGSAMTDIVLSVETRNQVSVSQVLAGKYVSIVGGINRSIATVQFKNLYQGEVREVLLQLSVPAVTSPVDAFELFSVSAVFTLSETAETQQADIVNLCVRREGGDHPDLLSAQRDIDVDVQMNRIDTLTAIERAIQAADRSDFSSANQIINNTLQQVRSSPSMAANHRITTSLLADLNEASTKVRSREEYTSRGGRSAMAEAYNESNYQRSCFTKSGKVAKYQTASSNVTQERALSSRAPTTSNNDNNNPNTINWFSSSVPRPLPVNPDNNNNNTGSYPFPIRQINPIISVNNVNNNNDNNNNSSNNSSTNPSSSK